MKETTIFEYNFKSPEEEKDISKDRNKLTTAKMSHSLSIKRAIEVAEEFI